MLAIACELKPHQVCLVPEKRTEVTTEGGLDVLGNQSKVGQAVAQLTEAGIFVSLFIDPADNQIEASKQLSAGAVEPVSYTHLTLPTICSV